MDDVIFVVGEHTIAYHKVDSIPIYFVMVTPEMPEEV